MRALVIIGLLLVSVAAGCLSSNSPATPTPAIGSAILIKDGAIHMDVPVPIFLIGFSADAAAQVRAKLVAGSFPTSTFSFTELVPTPRFEVLVPSAAWHDEFHSVIRQSTVAGNGAQTGFTGTILDGNTIEHFLAENLERVYNVPNGITSLVILDTGLRGHAYHYAGDVGWREPVRSFGERHGFLVWDPHATADPWVGTSATLHTPVVTASPEHIAAWVERATAIRALQGPIWPPGTLACHAVTVILAVRGTTVTPQVLGLQKWGEALDIGRLQATFENLTGDPVYVDLVVKLLPQDDPALELTTRENDARVITQNYLELNFDAYHVAHEGCEPYLSLVVYGDLADQRTSSNGNAVMMTPSGRRISTSLISENVRVMTEAIGYQQTWDESTNFERVGPGANPREWFNWVVSHETGHLFSLPHPNYSTGTPSFDDAGFSSTWNVMGYQMRRIVTEMSQIDAHNMQRHQAAFAILAATASDVPEETIANALQAMNEYRWKDATRLVSA